MSVFLTAAVVVMAVVTVVLNHLSHKEYTEEMERLRKDLVAARDKNDAYVSKEIVATLEQQNMELLQKLAALKVLNDKLKKKEQICQILNMNLESHSKILKESTYKLCKTKERNEESQETDKALNDQPHAHEQSALNYLLNDKFYRKRSVETISQETSQNFHSNFNDKISKMDDSISSLLHNYQKFTSQYQTKIGEHSYDVVSRFTTLGESMSLLVDDQCDTVGELEKSLSEQVSGSLELIRQQLDTSRATSDTEIRRLHTFHTVTLAEAIQKISRNSQLQKSVSETLKNSVDMFKQKFDTLQRQVLSLSEALHLLKDEFTQTIEDEVKKKEKFQQHIYTFEERQRKEAVETSNLLQLSQTHLQQALDLVKRASSTHLDHTEHMNATSLALRNDIVNEIHEKKQYGQSLNSRLNGFESKAKEIHQEYDNQIHNFIDTTRNSGEKVFEYTSDTNRLVGDLQNEIGDVIESEKTKWQEFHSWIEQQYRKQTEYHNTRLQNHFEYTRSLTSNLHESAVTQESVLESGRNELSTFVRESVNDLESECSYIAEWTNDMISEVRQRGAEVENLLFEDMKTEIPSTGYGQKKLHHLNVGTTKQNHIFEKYKSKAHDILSDSKQTEFKINGSLISFPNSLKSSSAATKFSGNSSINLLELENGQKKQKIVPVATTSDRKILLRDQEKVPAINSSSRSPKEITKNFDRKENKRQRQGSKKQDTSGPKRNSSKNVLKQHN